MHCIAQNIQAVAEFMQCQAGVFANQTQLPATIACLELRRWLLGHRRKHLAQLHLGRDLHHHPDLYRQQGTDQLRQHPRCGHRSRRNGQQGSNRRGNRHPDERHSPLDPQLRRFRFHRYRRIDRLLCLELRRLFHRHRQNSHAHLHLGRLLLGNPLSDGQSGGRQGLRQHDHHRQGWSFGYRVEHRDGGNLFQQQLGAGSAHQPSRIKTNTIQLPVLGLWFAK